MDEKPTKGSTYQQSAPRTKSVPFILGLDLFSTKPKCFVQSILFNYFFFLLQHNVNSNFCVYIFFFLQTHSFSFTSLLTLPIHFAFLFITTYHILGQIGTSSKFLHTYIFSLPKPFINIYHALLVLASLHVKGSLDKFKKEKAFVVRLKGFTIWNVYIWISVWVNGYPMPLSFSSIHINQYSLNQITKQVLRNTIINEALKK